MNTCRTGRAVLFAVLLLVLLQAGVAFAQEAAQTTQTAVTAPAGLPERRIVAWTNPVLFVFGWYMFEAEIRLQQNHTVGISGSFVHFEDGEPDDFLYEETDYKSVNVFYRYYPTASYKGFFIGGQIGRVQVEYKDSFEDTSGSAFSMGVLIGYGWLLGDAQRVAVSLGIGANRLVGGDVDEDASLTIPVIRLINVGVAF